MECTLCSVKYRSDADKQQHLQGRSHLKRVKSSSCTASHHVPSPSCPSTSSPHLIPSSSSARVSAPTTTLSSSLPSIPSQVARTVAAPDSIDHSSTKTIETLTQRERALQGNQDQTALESDETSKRSELQLDIDRETAATVPPSATAGVTVSPDAIPLQDVDSHLTHCPAASTAPVPRTAITLNSTSSPHLIPSSSSARVSAPTTTLSSSLPSIPSQVARTVAAPDSIDHSSTKTIETLTQRERALQGNQDQTALESDETTKRSETQDNNIDRETAETVAKLIAAGAIPQEHYHNLPYPPTAALDTIRSRGPRSAAPFHCSVCARNFHFAQDLSTHLKSRSHTELQDAYARGSRACAQYAFTLTQCALSLYSQRLPQPNEVSPGEQEYYDYMTQLLGPGSNFEQATKKLRESIALGSQRKENIRFFNALSEGFAGLTRFIEDDQMDQLDAEQETFFKHAATLDDDNDDVENDDGEDDEDEEEEFEDGPSGGYFDGNDYFD